jgi:hypothetical protein
MKQLTTVLLFVAAALVPATVSAVTIQEVVTLSKAGVADEVIVALIDRDRGVFPIDAAQLEELKTAGVSPAVVLAMLKSGLPAPQLPSAASLVAEGPQVVIVGHGPDVPNTSAADVYVMPVQFVMPYVVGYPATRGTCAGTIENHGPGSTHAAVAASATNPFGRFMNDPTARFINNGFALPGVSAVVAVAKCAPEPSPQERSRSRPRR